MQSLLNKCAKLVEVDPQKFRHLDYGYAVANFTPQMRQQFDRIIINLDMRELSPNDYLKFLAEHLAPSQSGNDVRLYTNSKLALNEKFKAQLGFGTVGFGREKREVSERIGGFSPALNREGSSGESLTHVGVRAGKEKQGLVSGLARKSRERRARPVAALKDDTLDSHPIYMPCSVSVTARHSVVSK